MKLDVDTLRYLLRDDFKVLSAVETGMRNHELVPAEVVHRMAGLKHGGTFKVLKNLLKHKLVHHDSSKYDGYRLTYLGYDFLAIKALVNRGVFSSVGRQIGVGKESDIFEVATEDGTIMAMKLHRLGRVSFRAVKSKRDYLLHRTSYNWLYLSRLAAHKEYEFMKALGEHGFPVPNAVDYNRHCVIMSLVHGYPLVQVKVLQNPDEILDRIMSLVVRLAEDGLIHCDFNEFNIMIDDDEKVTMIDFPQMVSVSHRNAQMYFDRDVECILKFFSKRFHLSLEDDKDGCDDLGSDVEQAGRPSFLSIKRSAVFLDKKLAASGFTRKDQDNIEKFIVGDELDSISFADEDSAYQAELESDGSATVTSTLHSLDLENKIDSSSINGVIETLEGPAAMSQASTINDCGATLEKETEGSDDCSDGGDAVLNERLSKYRHGVMKSARGGRRAMSSRNSYKDKGRNSRSSKVHMNAYNW